MIYKLLAIFWKDVLSAASYRLAFLTQFLSPLFAVVSFFFLSRLMGDALLPGLEQYGGDYFSFALVGIVLTTYTGISLHSVVSTIRTAQAMGTLEIILTTPTSMFTFLTGSLLYGLLQSTVTVVAFLALGSVVFGADFQGANLPAGVLVLAIIMVIMLGMGLISGSFVLIYKQGDPLSMLMNSGAFLLSGVAYPVAVLPDWLQLGSRIFPHTYALEALRLAMLQGASWSRIAPQLGPLLLYAAGALAVSLLFFNYALHRSRVEGSLAHY